MSTLEEYMPGKDLTRGACWSFDGGQGTGESHQRQYGEEPTVDFIVRPEVNPDIYSLFSRPYNNAKVY